MVSLPFSTVPTVVVAANKHQFENTQEAIRSAGGKNVDAIFTPIEREYSTALGRSFSASVDRWQDHRRKCVARSYAVAVHSSRTVNLLSIRTKPTVLKHGHNTPRETATGAKNTVGIAPCVDFATCSNPHFPAANLPSIKIKAAWQRLISRFRNML